MISISRVGQCGNAGPLAETVGAVAELDAAMEHETPNQSVFTHDGERHIWCTEEVTVM
jgi:hypothetical protein